MPRNFTLRAAACPAFLVALSVTASAHAAHVHVHGSARLDAHLARENGLVLVRGRATDDAGDALPNAAVRARVERKADARSITVSTLGASDCDPSGHAPDAIGDDTLVLRADDAGRFCVRVSLPIDQYVLHLSIEATTLLDATSLDVPLDLSARPLTLAFDPDPREVSLDDGPVTIETRASIDDDAEGPTASVEGLLLTLNTESGSPLGSATTDLGGHARFDVDPKKLGVPGQGELHVTYRGDAERTHAEATAKILRRARVHMKPAAEITGGAPDEGIAVPLLVTTGAGDAVAGGSVEARIGSVVVGAAPVTNGKSDLRVTFAAPSTATETVQLTYLSNAPWLDGSEPVSVVVPVHPPSAWKQLPLVLAAALVALFLVLERSRKPVRALPRPAPKGEKPSEPDVQLLAPAQSPGTGWVGRVVDAHERYPIERARVAIEHVSFGAPEILESVFTDADGRFRLGHEPKTGTLALSSAGWQHRGKTLVNLEARMVIDAPLHATLKKKLPPSGEVEIALVSRKRAILDRLVEWARLRGKPYDARPEPTPAHVQRAAAGKAGDIAAWAEAIERAAYAEGEVDARVEQEIEAIAPKNEGLPRPRS